MIIEGGPLLQAGLLFLGSSKLLMLKLLPEKKL